MSYIFLNEDIQTVLKDKNRIRFNKALVDGKHVTTNKEGDKIYFLKSGQFRFTFSGYIFPFSYCEMKLIFKTKKSGKDFDKTNSLIIPYSPGYIPVLFDTLLEVEKDQVITLVLETIEKTNVNVFNGCRLIITK